MVDLFVLPSLHLCPGRFIVSKEKLSIHLVRITPGEGILIFAIRKVKSIQVTSI